MGYWHLFPRHAQSAKQLILTCRKLLVMVDGFVFMFVVLLFTGSLNLFVTICDSFADSEVMDESFAYSHSSNYFIPAYNTWADGSLAANYPFNKALPSLDYVTPPPTAEGINMILHILSETSVAFIL